MLGRMTRSGLAWISLSMPVAMLGSGVHGHAEVPPEHCPRAAALDNSGAAPQGPSNSAQSSGRCSFVLVLTSFVLIEDCGDGGKVAAARGRSNPHVLSQLADHAVGGWRWRCLPRVGSGPNPHATATPAVWQLS